jgi:hypothetical protein
MFNASELVHSRCLLNNSKFLNGIWNDDTNYDAIVAFLNNTFCTQQAKDNGKTVALLNAYKYFAIVWTLYPLSCYIEPSSSYSNFYY